METPQTVIFTDDIVIDYYESWKVLILLQKHHADSVTGLNYLRLISSYSSVNFIAKHVLSMGYSINLGGQFFREHLHRNFDIQTLTLYGQKKKH